MFQTGLSLVPQNLVLMSPLPGLFLRGAGTGGLGLAIEGPSEAKMSCKDNKDGSCSVEYIPFTPGDYDVNITFGGLPIPGAGSRGGSSDSVQVSGAAWTDFQPPLFVLQEAHFGFQCESWWIPVK